MPTNPEQPKRPPVAVVMGHVDHGKTSLLDYIRKSNIAQKEAGGITQHIGAYEIIHNDRKITFLDTPGHEAFSMMRSRGSTAADIALLVVAADDGPKPQTLEAFNLIIQSGIPLIVVLTKIDKPDANIERVKRQLAEGGILLENFGGKIPAEEISSKSGKGIPELLDLVLLVADLADLSLASENGSSEGIVIESFRDQRRGDTTTILLRSGAVKNGDYLITASGIGKVKILEDFQGEALETAYPSQPVVIVGFDNVPPLGSKVKIISKKDDALISALQEELKNELAKAKSSASGITEDNFQRVVKAVLKADVAGSLEALEAVISKIHFKDIAYQIIAKDVGDLNETDIKNAAAFDAVIFGFRVPIRSEMETLAITNNVDVVRSSIIYELVDKATKILTEKAKPFLPRELQGEIEILAVFGAKGKEQIIGGKITAGKIINKYETEVYRKDEMIGRGRIANLQSNKIDVSEVEQGKEVGILFDSKTDVHKGDKLRQHQVVI